MFGSFYKMDLHPNSISFYIIFKGWLQKGNWEEASEVFDEMLERKVKPSVVTYSLIAFLCSEDDGKEAKGLFEDMV